MAGEGERAAAEMALKSMSASNQEFKFFLNVKRTVVVVSLAGFLAETNQHLLNECVKQVRAQATVRFVIFNLQALTGVDQAGIRALAIVQGALRENFHLLLCLQVGDLRRTLEIAGVIRESEIHKDLITALQIIVKMENGK